MYERYFGDRDSEYWGSLMARAVSIALALALALSLSLVHPSLTGAEGDKAAPPPTPEAEAPPPADSTPPPPPPPSEIPPQAVSAEVSEDASGSVNEPNSPPPSENTSIDPTQTPSDGDAGLTTDAGESGETGDDAPTGGGEDIPPTPPVVILTGDAQAVSDTTNVLNTNSIDTTPKASSTDDAATTTSGVNLDLESASGTPPWSPWDDHHAHGPLPLQSLTASTTNTATSTSGIAAGADSGGNGTESNYETIIDSGDAASAANLVNLLNVNLIDANGFLLLLNRFFGAFGNLDLRPYTESNALTEPCAEGCIGGLSALETTLANTNVATIGNDVVVRSRTGGNTVEGGGDGGASIATGDAYAAANVVNIANTNIVHSNYMVVMLNNFGDWSGDLVFPNDDYFARFFAQSVPTGRGPVSISNTNGAMSSTSLEVAAETGLNEATDNGSSSIETGNAEARGNVLNRLNRNEFGGGSILLVLRFFGDWVGDVFNAPEGLLWREGAGGLELYSNDPVFTPESGAGVSSASGGGGFGGLRSLSIENDNRADITNRVRVLALTGENRIASTSGESSIETGNAYAAANILNMANTNIIGRNWILAIVNIFGRWTGNVSFGQPDLWIGAEAESDEAFAPGASVTYRLTVANHGDAPASRVTVRGAVDRTGILHFRGGESGDLVGQPLDVPLGTLAAGETRTVTISANVAADIPVGDTTVTGTMRVSARETDGNPADNTESITVRVRRTVRIDGAVGSGSGANVVLGPDPVLKVTKQNFASTTLTASSTVDYAITITNGGGSAYHSVLIDTLKDERGRVVNEEEWELGEIVPGEEIRITYTSIFSASTSPGTYTNYAIVRSISRHPSLNPFYGSFSDSNIATSSVVIIGETTETDSTGVGGSADAIDPPVVELSVSSAGEGMSEVETIAAAYRDAVSRMAREVERVPAPEAIPSLSPVLDIPGGGSGDLGGGDGSVVLDPHRHTASVFSAFPWVRDRKFSLIFLLAAVILIAVERMQPRLWRRGFTGLF